MKNIESVIWDMDGTLINTASVVPDSFIATAAEFGGGRCTREEVVALYSLGVPENMLERLIGKTPSTHVMEHFYECLSEKSSSVQTYDGIKNCLSELSASVKLAVFTGASQRSAEILLNSVQLKDSFDLILGGDNYPPKPDPGGLISAASQLGSAPERCVYIGDAPSDIQAAISAKMVSIAAGWGHLYSEESQAAYVAERPWDVIKIDRLFTFTPVSR